MVNNVASRVVDDVASKAVSGVSGAPTDVLAVHLFHRLGEVHGVHQAHEPEPLGLVGALVLHHLAAGSLTT